MVRHVAQEVYSTLVSGFDVEIVFGDERTVEVELFEGGAPVWETVIDLTPFLNDGEEDTFTEDLISVAAQAAVDLFESDRETLGQGAETLSIEGRNMRKHAFCQVLEWENWFMGFKGTVFQEQATELLENLLDLSAATNQDNQVELNTAYQEYSQLEYRMSKLYFEKMKADPGGQTVIIINANKQAFHGISRLEDWLAKFSGHRLEPQAVAYAQEYLDLSAKIENLNNAQNDTYETEKELRFAMEELKLQLMQANLDQAMPDDGPDVAPKMMNDLYELADGVDFDEPLVPVSDVPTSLYEKPVDETQVFNTVSKRKAAEDEDKDDDSEGGPIEVQELGQLADGLQIAEVPIDEYPFNVSERIELNKEFEQTLWGGITRKIPKGTKGTVDDLYDRAGDFYMVRFDDGRLVKIPYEYLKRLKKGG